MAMEDTRRRNEASMARKRMNPKVMNPAAANAGDGAGSGSNSPSSTGAMDSLLEKLRAAAPQARDQRDRRRRARLKDRHQIRVASGQTIPDMGDLTKDSEGEDLDGTALSPEASVEGTEPKITDMATISEGEDIADRAASLLQGLRGDGEGEPVAGSQSGSIRVRRRRESADDERRSRRRRRGAATSSTDDRESTFSPSLEQSQEEAISEEPPDRNHAPTPTTVVSPPSPGPDGSRLQPVELSD